MDRQSCRWLSLLMFVPTLTIGCAPAAPKTVKVKGVVTFAGSKLTSGTIAFIPETVATGEPMRPVAVELNPAGEYTLSSFNPGDGIIPGNYLVTVVSYDRPPGGPGAVGQEIWAIPRKYGNTQTSGLRATISEDDPQPVELDFDLEGEKDK